MSLKPILSSRLKLGLSIFWVAFTFTFVLWWWIFALLKTETESQKVYRMFFWEGLALLPVLFLGGIALVYLTYKDYQRNQQLRLFFSNFTHDIKTSITRLRLQMDLLEDEANGRPSPAMSRLMNDLAALDLQLENSLFLAKADEQNFFIQKADLSTLIGNVRPEFPELEIRLEREAQIEVDSQAFKSLLRNLLQNASQHGRATLVRFNPSTISAKRLMIEVEDNGSGISKEIPKLGKEMISSTTEGGHGIGLYLCRRLIEKMHGKLHLVTGENNKFIARIEIPGRLSRGS